MAKYLDMPGLTYFYNQIKNKFASKTDVGAPAVASTVSAMTDHNKIYVYTGSESGYTAGNWYYYDAGSWESGGVYNATAYITDKTLSEVDKPADAKTTGDEIADLKSALLPEGLVDVLAFASPDSTTIKNVTYTFNADGSCTVTGTATSLSFVNYYSYSSSIPYWMDTGKTYYLYYESENVSFQIFPYKNGELGPHILSTKEDATVTIPDDVTGLIIRLAVGSGKTVNETVHPKLLTKNASVNKTEKTIYETKYITQDTYNNSYSTTINPTITLDSNGWLQPVDTDTENEDNKTDMTPAIMSMLTENGYCHLAPGIYYVSGNIDMPANSTIIGCGRATTIRLLSSVSSGYCIKLASDCIVKDLSFSGGYSEITLSDGNIGGRNGIYLKGNNRHNILTNCYFYHY